ncbi:MAG: class I tRNA ligase family protein, partial [Terriglobales bacterium]
RKIRNTFRNMLGNLADFDPAHAVPFAQMEPLDQYMLMRTAEMCERVRQWYDEMTFHRAYHQLNEFCTVDLSAIYFDVLKDRLYTAAPNSLARRSAQTALWHIAEAMVRLVAPVMSFTADEIWEHLPKVSGRLESVHLAHFPAANDVYGQEVAAASLDTLRTDWSALMAVREEALKALEVARQEKTIGSALESKVKISAPEPLYATLRKYESQLRALLIVSGVEVTPTASGNGSGSAKVEVLRADGQKCERCWNYSVHVGENHEYPTVCERCSAAIQEITGVKRA